MKYKKRIGKKTLFACLVTSGIIVTIAMAPSHTENIVTEGMQKFTVVNRPFSKKFKAKTFYSGLVDNNNTKWFLTETGIASYNGENWFSYHKNKDLPSENLRNFAYEFSSEGPGLWLATPDGIKAAILPVNNKAGIITYNTENTSILSNNILAVVVGKSALRWFGTDKGISAFYNNKWLTESYRAVYNEAMFRNCPVTAMATTPGGDSLYVATKGAGVARLYRDKVDAISGASEYSQWGSIDIPSDYVYSICITPDGTQWFGTDKGAARHTGNITLANWTRFNKENGLADDFVQAIAVDKQGKLWFGTKGGVSIFDGSAWTSLSTKDGLCSNNILCITVDKNGIVWAGTDNGVMSFDNTEIVCYK
jgi:ligand-binding sensor domain-containing protein